MNKTLELILELVRLQDVRISVHGYDELAADGLLVREILAGVSDAVLVEHYPDYHKGPCVLVLQEVPGGHPVHVVWGIPRGARSPAVLVTAYRPNPEHWQDSFTRRKS